MKRVGLAVALAVSLSLVPGVASAGHRHHGVHTGFHAGHATVFISPHPGFIHGHPFAHQPFVVQRHFIHPGFIPPGFIDPRFGSTFIVAPAPQPVWVPGVWWWDGFQWVWVAGHWVFPQRGLFLRNPCD